MERVRVSINDNDWFLRVAKTPEEREKGLQGVKKLRKSEGMLFIFDEPQDVTFHMKNTHVPLDIIFVNEDDEVISVKRGIPESEDLITESDVLYVIEVRKGSGVEPGDAVDFEEDVDDITPMQILAPDGSVQYELQGGERIVSRRETKILIKKAKKAFESQSDSDFKSLGRYLFKVFKKQNNREPEYVKSPNN
jgi:uncharacterized membrane protein (UPF0127 family)